MAGFSGSFTGTLDSKNRLHLPVRLRQSSEVALDNCQLTLGVDEQLFLFPGVEWQRVEAKFENFNFAHPDANFVLRMLMSNKVEVSPDRQSRILIPPDLALKAALKKDIRVVGMIKRIEIWDEERFQQYLKGYGKTYAEVAAQLLL
jgi:MraZ protein